VRPATDDPVDRVRHALLDTATGLAPRVAAALGPVEAAGVGARLRTVSAGLAEVLVLLYGDDAEELGCRLVTQALAAAARRTEPLRARDQERAADPAWFLSQEAVGYVCYVDRYAGTLRGLLDRLDHLTDLGVTYVHLMPLLLPRAGEDDGGYAVADYGQVDPRLGTMADLAAVAHALHTRGMSLCVDLVLNHTADDHAWARAAAAGDPAYADRYLSFPDRTMPDAYERTLPQVFPDTAPGSFTFEPQSGRWFWSTFHDWQWDLDHSAPATFEAMLDVMFFLLEQGVDVLRLDAVPFTGKRLGTDCQNQPEAHLLLQAFRALVTVAAPGAVFKAEAIVPPDQLVQYLGAHEVQRPECELAYHNQLMVLLWSTAATRDTGLMVHALNRLRRPPQGTGWVTYLRGHDDIGWAITDEDASAVGLSAHDHRRFLADFYAGRHAGSFAVGADFQRDPATGDVRTSGTTASLCGIEQALALGDPLLLDHAVRRLLLMHSVLYAYGGLPLLFSGDEVASRNDPDWARHPKAGRDNRWMHRPYLDWEAVARSADGSTVEGRVAHGLRELAAARRALPGLRGDGTTTLLDSGNRGLLAVLREHPSAHPVLALANVADAGVPLPEHLVGGWTQVAGSDDPGPGTAQDRELPALGWAWLVRPSAHAV
jgi:amylosucrase